MPRIKQVRPPDSSDGVRVCGVGCLLFYAVQVFNLSLPFGVQPSLFSLGRIKESVTTKTGLRGYGRSTKVFLFVIAIVMVVVIVYSSGSGVDVVIVGHSVIFAVMSLLLSLLSVVNCHRQLSIVIVMVEGMVHVRSLPLPCHCHVFVSSLSRHCH